MGNLSNDSLAARTLGLVRSTDAVSSQQHLPLAPMSFIGRAENINRGCRLLQDHSLVTIVGPGGMSKTRLALEDAMCFRQNEQLVTCFVSLAAYSQAEVVPLALAEHLGITVREQQSANPNKFCDPDNFLYWLLCAVI